MGGRRPRQEEWAGGDTFHGGLRQLARLLAAAIEVDQDLGRSAGAPTDPVRDLLDIGSHNETMRRSAPLSAVEADR